MAKDDDKGGGQSGGGNQGGGGGGNPGPGGGGGGGNEGHDKEVTIYVNTRAKKWKKEKISFEELVALAQADTPPPTGANIEYHISFRNGDDHQPEGQLAPHEKVKVKDGEIFDVFPTDKS